MAWSRGNARWCSAHFLLWIHPGLCCPHSEWGFPLQLNFLESPSRHSHCWVSMVILNIIKLASSCPHFPPTGRLYTLNWEPVCTLHQVTSQQAFGHINEKGNQTGESVSPTSANHIFFCKQSTYKSILHNSQMFQLISLTDIIHPRLTDHTHVSHTPHTRLTHSLLNTDCSSSSERRVTVHGSLFLLSFICGLQILRFLLPWGISRTNQGTPYSQQMLWNTTLALCWVWRSWEFSTWSELAALNQAVNLLEYLP